MERGALQRDPAHEVGTGLCIVGPLPWPYMAGFAASDIGAGEISISSNARVPAGPVLSAFTVSIPVAIASATHRRPAASKARRQTGRQKTCRLPPSRRGVNPFPHYSGPLGCVIGERALLR
jgi:hypothetical protein